MTALTLLGPDTDAVPGQESPLEPFFYISLTTNEDLAPLIRRGRAEFLQPVPSRLVRKSVTAA